MVITIAPGHFDFDSEQALQVLGLKHLVFRSFRDDPSSRHQQHAFDLWNYVGKIMGHQDDSYASLGQRTHGVTQALPSEDVQRVARFIEEQGPRFVNQCAGDEHTPRFSRRHFGNGMVARCDICN